MRYQLTILVLFVTLCIITPGFTYADFVLVDEGKPTGAILLGEHPTAIEKHAAAELARYVKEMSGAKLPIYRGLEDVSVLPENVVVIGRAKTNEKVDRFVRGGLIMLDCDNPGYDGFVLKAIADGRNWLVIGGSIDRGTLFGVYHLLEKYLKVGFFWDGDRVPRTSTVSLPINLFEESRPYFPNRQNIQGCAYGFSTKYWNLDDWKGEIDWTAKKKFNTMQLDFGWEAVMQQDVYSQFGVEPKSTNEWEQFQSNLARDACAYARSIGIRPVTKSFEGIVSEEFCQANPDVKYMKVGWATVEAPSYIYPADPMFKKVFIAFQKANNAEYGTSHLYETNPFPEVDPGDTPEQKLELKLAWGRAISEGLREVDPAGVFVLSAWAFLNDPGVWKPEIVKEFLETIDDDQIIVNDIFAEHGPIYKRLKYFYDKPWGFSVLHSFGGNWTLHGNIRGLIKRVLDVVQDPKARRRCVNFYINPEIIHHNYLYFDLCTKLAWNPEGVVLEDFVADYAVRRYGKESAPVLEKMLWELVDSIYNVPPDALGYRLQPFYQHIVRINRLYGKDDFPGRRKLLPRLKKALKIGLGELDKQKDNRLYETDMMDIALQYIGDLFNEYLLRSLTPAFRSGEKDAFEASAAKMLRCMDFAERITATRKDYMLAWEIDKGLASPGGRDSVTSAVGGHVITRSADKEVRVRTTVLVDLEYWQVLPDYAHKNAYELIKFYYRPRIEAYINFLRRQMDAGVKEPDFSQVVLQYKDIVFRFVEDGYQVRPDEVFQDKPLDAVEAVFKELNTGQWQME